MSFREDQDLDFLGELKSQDLNTLVEILTTDPSDGKLRNTEGLTSKPEYKKYAPDHAKYWSHIAAEIQHYGANSMVSLLRRKGVCYKEIAQDVADKIKANYDKSDSIDQIEKSILLKLLGDSLEKMTEEQRKNFIQGTELDINLSNFSTDSILKALKNVFNSGGSASYILTYIITNSILSALVGRVALVSVSSLIGITGSLTLSRSIGALFGPVGLAITGGWTLFDLAGPAYRVTIPTVVQVALLRQLYQAEKAKYLDEIKKQINLM